MADNIDQTMSLKAALKDEVSPSLQKIHGAVDKTKAALNDFVDKVRSSGTAVSSAVGDMEHKNKQAQDSIQSEVKKTGGAFQELGKEASTSSQQIGAALDNAFRTGKSARTADELDNELTGLKRTLEGMASTNRPLSAKSKNMKALGSDTLNRKVIPAFQSLHDTLDGFPEVLGDINAVGKQQISLSQKMQQSLSAVNERVSGLGDTFNKLKITMLDFVGAITTSYFGIQGAKLREHQTTAGRQRGRGAFRGAAETVPLMQLLSRAPDDVWGPAYETLLDTSKLALTEFPNMIDQMVDLSKATGLTSATFADLFVQMKEISGLTGDEWTNVTQKINFFASESRASIEDIANALASSTDEMLGFSRAARKAYAEQSMVAAAQSANAGVGAGAGKDLFSRALGDTEFRSRLKGLSSYGTGLDLENLIDTGQIAEFNAEVATILGNFTQQQFLDKGLNPLKDPNSRAFSQITGGVDIGQSLRYAEALEKLRAKGTNFHGEKTRLEKAGQEVDFAGLVGDIRSTGKEKIEQIGAIMSASGMQIGKHTMTALEKGLDPVLAIAAGASEKLNALPEMAKQGISFFSIGLNVMSGLEQLLRGMGLDGLAGMISGPIEKVLGATLGAYGLSQVMGGDGSGAGGAPSVQQQIAGWGVDKPQPIVKDASEYLSAAQTEISRAMKEGTQSFDTEDAQKEAIRQRAAQLASLDEAKQQEYDNLSKIQTEMQKSSLRRGVEGLIRGKVNAHMFMLKGLKNYIMPSEKELSGVANYAANQATTQGRALNAVGDAAAGGYLPGTLSPGERDLAVRTAQEHFLPGSRGEAIVGDILSGEIEKLKVALVTAKDATPAVQQTTEAVNEQTVVINRGVVVQENMAISLEKIANSLTPGEPRSGAAPRTVTSTPPSGPIDGGHDRAEDLAYGRR